MVEMGFRVEQPLKRLQGFHSLQFLLLLEAKGLHLDPSWSELELQLSVSKLSSVIQGGAIYESLRANSNCACVAAIEVMVKTPMVPPNNSGPDLTGKDVNETQYRGFDLKGYSDSDYACCNMDTKSTSDASKAEYVAAARCYTNILWMKSQLTYYDIIYEKVPIFCDNTSAIAISTNSVLYSRTKHIDIRYHILKRDIELHFIPTQ
ncbi:hypothetical protein Tco_0605559 [Tanacetum coccineum]